MKKNKSELLLVEDDVSLGQTISELLIVNNYNVKWCQNGLEAFQYLENNAPDLIVCDLMMPVMSGEELFLKIRNFRKFDQIPFIIITADMTFESKIKQLQNGVNDFINKPFKIQELVLKIKNFLYYKENVIKQAQNPISKIQVKSRKNDFFEKIDEIIIRNIKTDITIEKLSKEIFVSKSTLDKKIRKFKEVNVSTYIREIRLNYAISLIEAGEVNVDTLANESGFNSTSYFSICFKNYTGLSPKKYIKQKIQGK
ncbi:response regulator [Flavobacterium sp. N2820]|jgi:DNA-binding response OmpR family regulator|uniref:response regulator transcription factor n=1 Tax=Flavobacterium sp. N2820 TaxID=2986834 RepID=UPI0022243B85|nr:response regulator [Flavobacterium sp. N2820]